MVVALCLSGSVLLLTFWPAVRDDHLRVSIAIMSAIVVLNILLAVGSKVRIRAFFHFVMTLESRFGSDLTKQTQGGGIRYLVSGILALRTTSPLTQFGL